ncbi:hypothetical protein PEBR_07860 [Penicillium brasilianum]|uniref:DUF7779 domain-containing protein n=1 Tax=Penicillium brasilianum TaxID=104259 RepID=A0A1S9RVU7_PENBI|nr:hypothetical protein PEBR_07860 [Penicillium brasilianum]
MASTTYFGINNGVQVGNNYGEFTAEFHLPPERPETPPSPLSTVPITRNPDFVGRDTLLQRIHDKCSVLGSSTALVGLGGVGKSQLAIEYSYRIGSQSPAIWVFWVHASSAGRFKESFWDIADQVKIPGRQNPHINILKQVENLLRDKKRGKWFLILDSVDDEECLRKPPATGPETLTYGQGNAQTKPLWKYIPRVPHGSILITSRTQDVALRMVDHKDLIEVTPMEKSEALELLQRKLELPGESQGSGQLVEELEFMPLSIIQAASYIRNQAPLYSVLQYLRDFRKSDREAIRLLENEAGHCYRDWEAKNSILVTWQMSFDHIRQKSPTAADLLSLMSFFDRQGIPENLLRTRYESSSNSITDKLDDSSDHKSSNSDIDYEFRGDITTLRNYSFISVSVNGRLFTMHRLVQLTTFAWLEIHGKTEQWKGKFISNLYNEFPINEYENWEKCQSLFPHVQSAMSHRPTSQESLLQWTTVLFKGACYGLQSGNIAVSREMVWQSRNQRMKLMGLEDEEALASTVTLATAYWAEGWWEKAEKLYLWVMEVSKAKFGDNHPSTLASTANLAVTYLSQGRWEEAEKLFLSLIDTAKTKFGDDHFSTLMSIANLAQTYSVQGRWNEAEKLLVQVIQSSKTKVGGDHPITLSSMTNLASTYIRQGRWKEAEKLSVQVIESSKMKLGENHPATLASEANLALTYRKWERVQEAEKLLERVVETRKTNVGDDHPDTLSDMANLALVYESQGRSKEAEKLFVQVMETRKTKLGEDHPNTLFSMASLALFRKSAGQNDDALELLQACLAKQSKILGPYHPHTLATSEILLEWAIERLHISIKL